MNIVDTHCHLYESVFDIDRQEVIERSIAKGVDTVLLPNIDTHTLEPLLTLCSKYPTYCYPMLGIHPCYINPDSYPYLSSMELLLGKHHFIGIGEIGLDYYHDTTHKALQISALQTQLDWSVSYQLPVSLHSRNATQDLIHILQNRKQALQGVFHCFTEHISLARQILDLGFYIGIGGVLTYKKASIADTLRFLPKDRVVLETDAPYLPPDGLRGKRNEPSYLPIVIEKITQCWGIPTEEVSLLTTQNARNLFFGNKYKTQKG